MIDFHNELCFSFIVFMFEKRFFVHVQTSAQLCQYTRRILYSRCTVLSIKQSESLTYSVHFVVSLSKRLFSIISLIFSKVRIMKYHFSFKKSIKYQSYQFFSLFHVLFALIYRCIFSQEYCISKIVRIYNKTYIAL